MHNLLQFIVKYSNFLLFIGLEIAAFVLLFHGNSYQHSAYVTSANRVTGTLYESVDKVTSYFLLAQENQALSDENARLQEEIQLLKNALEPFRENDSTYLYGQCRYRYAHTSLHYIPAKVVNTDAGWRHNYFTINKGRRDGIVEDYGVVDQGGVVGIVCAVSERFSLVLPLTNDRMSLSCRFKNNKTFGPLVWGGTDYRYAQLENIPRHAEVHAGDTIITSGLTPAFPEGIVAGVVEEAVLEETDAYYHIRVRFTTDFHRLGYVQVIANEALREQMQLENIQ